MFIGALAAPWLTWWMGAFGDARGVVALERVVEYRPAMVALPGGKYWMGSTVEEQDRARMEVMLVHGEAAKDWYRNEVRHEVEVGNFELCQTEVTQGQWKAVMGVDELKTSECGEDACDDEKPITGVTWDKAVDYLNRLTEKENEWRGEWEQWTVCYRKKSGESIEWERGCSGYRLPTEAEWEYATRAGSATAYFFGDDATKLCEHGNVADRTAQGKYPNLTVVDCEDGAMDLARVGSYQANAWGLYDVHGNVAEWVWDWYGDYNEKPPKNYAGPESGDLRVLRGGSFKGGASVLRSASRFWDAKPWLVSAIGLRCARGPHISLERLRP